MKTMRLVSILVFAASLPVVGQTAPDLAGLVDAQLPGLVSTLVFFASVSSSWTGQKRIAPWPR